MNGIEMYEKKYIDKINHILNQHRDKTYLSGFYYFINNNMSYSSAYDYLNYILKFMEYIQKNPTELTLDDYTKYLSTLRMKTSSYQISVYSALKKFSLYLQASEQNVKHSMQYVSRPKAVETKETREKRENGVLNKKEIKTYLTSVDAGTGTKIAAARQENWKERDLLIIYLFLSTGMRCSALYKLDVNNINLQERTIIITDKRDHVKVCSYDKELNPYISAWLKKRDLLLNGKEEMALFISNQRTRMDQSSISRVVQKYSNNITGKKITPHKLRATYGSLIYEETNDLYLTQKCMGHTNPKTTELYIRGQEDDVRKRGVQAVSKNLFLVKH